MSILIVTGIEGAQNCAAAVEKQLDMAVEVAEGRRTALAALRRKEFAVIVVDETLAECDPAAAEAIWERAGLAIPLQINFALSGAARLMREIRAGTAAARARAGAGAAGGRLGPRNRNEDDDCRAAAALATGALGGGEVPAAVADKLRVVADLADDLRQQLSTPAGAARAGGLSRRQIFPRSFICTFSSRGGFAPAIFLPACRDGLS